MQLSGTTMQFIALISLLFFQLGRVVGHILIAIGIVAWRVIASLITARVRAKSGRKVPPILR